MPLKKVANPYQPRKVTKPKLPSRGRIRAPGSNPYDASGRPAKIAMDCDTGAAQRLQNLMQPLEDEYAQERLNLDFHYQLNELTDDQHHLACLEAECHFICKLEELIGTEKSYAIHFVSSEELNAEITLLKNFL